MRGSECGFQVVGHTPECRHALTFIDSHTIITLTVAPIAIACPYTRVWMRR